MFILLIIIPITTTTLHQYFILIIPITTTCQAKAWVIRYPLSNLQEDSYGDEPHLPPSPLRPPVALATFNSSDDDLDSECRSH